MPIPHIVHIARFELVYHLRRPITYVFALLITAQAIWYSTSLFAYYANDKTFVNSPANLYLVMASFGMVIAVMASVMAGQSLTKDLDHKAVGYLYTLPVSDKTYFIGKFLGTYVAVLLVALFYPLGTLLLPLLVPDQTGPVFIGPLLDGFLRVIPQNVLFVTGMAFSMTVFTRRMLGAYLSMLLLIAYFLLMESNREAAFESDLLLLDPFCFGITKESVDALSTVDKNTGYLPFADFFIINRLLWLGIGLGLLVKAEARFSFQDFVEQPTWKLTLPQWLQRQAKPTLSVRIPTKQETPSLPTVHPMFDRSGQFRQLGLLSRIEFRTLVRQPLFLIGLVVLVCLVVVNAFFYRSPGADLFLLPLTAQMTALRHPIGICISLFLMVLAGEIMYREETTKFRLIVDSLPHKAWVPILAKLMAMIGLAALLTACFGVTTLAIQLMDGLMEEINWSLYAHDLILDGFFGYCQRIVLAIFVAVLLNNRYTGHFVAIACYLLLVVADALDPTNSSSALFSFLPGSTQYSDLTGYGQYAVIQLFYQGLWWSITGILLSLAIWWQHRGISEGFRQRIGQWPTHFSPTYGIALVAFSLLALGMSWPIARQPASVSAKAFDAGIWQPTLTQYQSQTQQIKTQNRTVPVTIYARHTYNQAIYWQAITDAVQQGVAVFGSYPYPSLTVAEVPFHGDPVVSVPGRIFVSEKRGWFADLRRGGTAEVYQLIARQVLEQWLGNGVPVAKGKGSGFLRHGIAEYLAIQLVEKRYGATALTQQLAHSLNDYKKGRSLENKQEPTLVDANGDEYVERHKANLVLNSLAQVWSYDSLNRFIGQFYRTALAQKTPDSVTANQFASQLTGQLPDTLHTMTSYFKSRFWFDFQIGTINIHDDKVVFGLYADKWSDDGSGNHTPLPIEDYVVVSLLNNKGQILYKQSVFLGPDEPPIRLPLQQGAAEIVIDPLGTFPDVNPKNNRKRLAL